MEFNKGDKVLYRGKAYAITYDNTELTILAQYLLLFKEDGSYMTVPKIDAILVKDLTPLERAVYGV